MYDKLMKWSGIIGIFLLTLMLAGMLYYSANKTLIYVQAGDGEGWQPTDPQNAQLVTVIPEERTDMDKFYIPVGSFVTQEAIYIENDYMNHRMVITVSGMTPGYYDDHTMYGDLEGIASVQAGFQNDGLILILSMEQLYEYEAMLENQRLVLAFYRPAELYDRIVVLDAGHGNDDRGIYRNGISEAATTLDVAERVKKILEAEGIRVYLTRNQNVMPDAERRILFARDAQADLLISLHLADGEEYGINAYYNDRYYIPELTNAEFADLLVSRSAAAVRNRGNGVFAIEQGSENIEDLLLFYAQAPAVRLELGCLANAEEAALLSREDYRDDLARGICQAVREAFEMLED